MSQRNGDKARFDKAKKKRLRHRENMRKLTAPKSPPKTSPKAG